MSSLLSVPGNDRSLFISKAVVEGLTVRRSMRMIWAAKEAVGEVGLLCFDIFPLEFSCLGLGRDSMCL